ncbi:MAG TPA: GatB/YqeY domain-containing protein, partial [Calditerricola sp.]
RSAIKNEEIEKGRPLTDDDVIAVLHRELKQRRDSLHEFEKAGRQDLVDKVKAEIEVLTQYLPEQLSDEELLELIRNAVQEVGATSKKDLGKVMRVLMPKVKGRADGKRVNALVQQVLGD